MSDGATPFQEAASGAWASIWYAGKRVLVTGGTSGIGAGWACGSPDAAAEGIVSGVTEALHKY